jgi:acyl dehydratase
MSEKKRADQVTSGEEFEPYEFQVTPEFNQQYLEAIEDYHPRYLKDTDFGPPAVHPALLVAQSNVTRSPSFYLPSGMAAVHAKEEVEYLNPARVGKKIKVSWKVVAIYEKRGRPYQVKEALIVDEDGTEILKRRITDTYIAGGG